MMRFRLFLVQILMLPAVIFAISTPDQISAREPVTEANWTLYEEWAPDKLRVRMTSTKVEPNWLPESDIFWYRYRTSEGVYYWLVDPQRIEKRPLFDHAQLANKLMRFLVKQFDQHHLDLQDIEFTDGNRVMRFTVEGMCFSYCLDSGELAQIDEPDSSDPPREWENTSPDRRRCVFARGNNLFLLNREHAPETEKQLTFDGIMGYSWGSSWELVPDDTTEPRWIEAAWSGDSRYFSIIRADCRKVEDLWRVDYLNERHPTLETFKYPMPGREVPQYELWICDSDSGKMTQIAIDRWPDQSLIDLFHDLIWWSDDSSTLYFCRRSRDHKNADLCAVDPATGKSRILVEERQRGMVYIRPLTELSSGEEFIWWSHREGWGRFYLYSKEGRLKNQITRGAFNAERILGVDEINNRLYFMANGREAGRNPYYQHLYSVNLDGTGMRLLTPEDAQHVCFIASSNRYFVDNCSRVDQATQSVLRDHEGNLVLEMERVDMTGFEENGWRAPEVFSAKAANGRTDIWGVMFKPFDFDPDKKYPIITRVYPGRFSEMIPLEFSQFHAENYLANLGSIVVWFGNRGGTRVRGVEYREYARDQFRDYGLADKKAVIEELARQHDYIDIDRVGICGGSSGGFMTVSAMLVYPDFFKVGVARTAPNDPNQYLNEWVERYMDITPIENEDGSIAWETTAPSNIELADSLKGHLLMIYGGTDEIVHPGHLLRMSNAFIQAGKYFDMFIIPDAGHSLGDWRYVNGLMWRYFAMHLIEGRMERIDAGLAPR